MQLSMGRTPLDSFYDSIGPSTPQLLDQDPPSSDFFALAASCKDPLSGYPSLAHLSTAAISDPSSSSSGSFVLGADSSPPPPEPHGYSFLNFKYGCNPIFSGSSILSFEQSVPQRHQFEDYSAFADAFEQVDQNGQINIKCGFGLNGLSCVDSSNRSSVCISKEIDGDELFGWIYSDTSATMEHRLNQGSDRSLEGSSHKRSYTGGELQPSKKHCGGNQKKPKITKPSASKDPQSIAAKNRRERISERLKILQDLVPNGTKVDLVTMLEKAISYVKFLQLQVKVLSTDELWPSQGGKAPEISQVRDVIDSILSSHRERTSGSM